MRNQIEKNRKIPDRLENPIDVILLNLADQLNPIFKSMNFTPNGITTLSTITGFGSLYYLYNHDITRFSIYALISYFFDVMDGNYARVYNMTSEGGDIYDHYKDIFVIALGIYIYVTQYNLTSFPIIALIMLTSYVLVVLYVGNQEALSPKKSKTFSYSRNLVKGDPEYNLSYLKYFSPVVVLLLQIYLTYNLEMKYRDSVVNLTDL